MFQCLRLLALKSPYGIGQGPRSRNNKNVDFEKNYKHFELKMESNMKGAKEPQQEGRKNTILLLAKIIKIRYFTHLSRRVANFKGHLKY